MLNTLANFLATLADPAMHFWLALLCGLVVFWWMWIILFASLSGVAFTTRKPASMVVVYGIIICCLVLGFSAALASHWALNYFTAWYQMPLGPHLDLNIP